MNWLVVISNLLNRVPIERVIFRPRDNTESLEKFLTTMGALQLPNKAHPEQKPTPTPTTPTPTPTTPTTITQEPKSGGVPPGQLIDYQKREIGKLLLRMENHYAQKLRIMGIPCDCGAQKHLLDMESLCEETIPIVDDSQVYYNVLAWIKTVGPKSTDEAAKSGLYDEEYPGFSHQARDFRKEIIGGLDPKALFPQKPGEPQVTLEEA